MRGDVQIATRLCALFAGHTGAHGTYEVTGGRGDGKRQGKAVTVRAPVTVELWQQHLAGEMGLGIIPIDPESMARWGCIDIDTYPLDHRLLVEKFEASGVPVVVCRSKSGGAHVFLFTSEKVPARDLRDALRRLASSLGYGNCEIFPKQSLVLSERGDLGNWLNMPYQRASQTMRYAFGTDGEPLTVEQFLDFAESRCVSPDTLTLFSTHSVDQDVIVDGPPCLEMLVSQGIPAGTRNNGLFAIGVYMRKAHPDDWEQRLEAFNRERLNPPKASAELQSIIKSLKKRDYGYRCSEPPISGFCDRTTCLSRRYGIGGGRGTGAAAVAMPTLGSLTKQETDPPIFWLDVSGQRLELTTEDLMSQHRFGKRCVEKLNLLPPRMREPDWHALLSGLLETVTTIEAPHDASIEGLFRDLVEQYCVSRHQAKTRDEILLGKPWAEDGTVMFRMSGLRNFLQSQRFQYYEPPVIMARLKDMGGLCKPVNFKGRVRSVWVLPGFDAPEPIEPPPIRGDKEPF